MAHNKLIDTSELKHACARCHRWQARYQVLVNHQYIAVCAECMTVEERKKFDARRQRAKMNERDIAELMREDSQ